MRQTNPTNIFVSEQRATCKRGWAAIGICLSVAFCLPSPAGANTYTVGSGGCNAATIAIALTDAENNPGPDTIRITRSANYTAQAINFTTSQELTLTGGYADCATATEDDTKTTLSGLGGAAAAVLKIHGNTGSLIRLRKLTISSGDVPNNGSDGGGIDYTGNGLLDIANTAITGNTGAYGGGINAAGEDDAAELDIGPGVTITGNKAYFNGGGVYSNNLETVIRGDDTSIRGNHALGVGAAGGFGGGIHIRACARKSIVYLSSGNFTGVVGGNDARYGGGVAIETPSGCNQPADLRMFSTSASMTRIYGNGASVSGGGIYIYREGGTANVYVWNAAIQGNYAPIGAAMYLGDGGNAYFNEMFSPVPPRPDGAVDCAVGVPCGYIIDNLIVDNLSSTGQVIYGSDNNFLDVRRTEITGNQGNELIRTNRFAFYDSLIADNTSAARLLQTHNGFIGNSTIAGNQVGGPEIIGIDTAGTFSMTHAVTWQPGKTILRDDGEDPYISDVVSNEIASFAGNSGENLVANPRFIDSLHGDYRPTAASPVIDYALTGPTFSDLLSLPRPVDLDLVQNLYGAYDVGAYERQAIQPLVENGDFLGNAYVWQILNSAAASYDNSQNAPGSTVGSLHIKFSPPGSDTVVGAVQCIHLPGPGVYALNGSGKVASGQLGNNHYAKLYWELRLAGSETCAGIPNAMGELTLAATGNVWHRPTTPASIIVTPQQFTADTSVAIYLEMKLSPGSGRANGIDSPADGELLEGWIDHVSLSVGPDDVIFKNGFESP